MKVETPQILWNAAPQEHNRHPRKKGGSKAVNAALYSVDLLACGAPEPHSHILVTAGNTSTVNVWQLLLPPQQEQPNDGEEAAASNNAIFQRKPTVMAPTAPNSNNNSNNFSGLSFRFSLGREGFGAAISCCRFSPDGLTLAVACDVANLQLYSVPVQKRVNGNGRHHWAACTQESDLQTRIVSTGEGVSDISWSADGQRVFVGTVDHAVCLVQRTGPEDFQVVYRSAEHTHFVQGVAYDPMGVYLASMSNDRSVRIYPRKATAKTLKKILKPLKQQQKQHQEEQQQNSASTAEDAAQAGPLQASSKSNGATAVVAAAPASPSSVITPEQAVQDWLANTKFDVAKSRIIKHAPRSQTMAPLAEGETKQAPRHAWFADESTLESFFRRLTWTPDGHFLICPAALYKPPSGPQQHAALVFARHNFEEPHKILTGFDKPAVAVRPNPVCFDLPAAGGDLEKENTRSYRSIFCVLTWDSVLIYDTHHAQPLAVATGLHYANLTDASWSADGHSLIVSSSDGYVSLIRFAPGELGIPRRNATRQESCPAVQSAAAALTKVQVSCNNSGPVIPPCEPGPVQPPASRPVKRAKLVSSLSSSSVLPQKRDTETASSSSLQEPNVLVPKKKKRVQPTPVVQ